jgi:hypothetical protein
VVICESEQYKHLSTVPYIAVIGKWLIINKYNIAIHSIVIAVTVIAVTIKNTFYRKIENSQLC